MWISLLIAGVFVLTFVLNNLFLSDYYLHEKKNQLSSAVAVVKSSTPEALKKNKQALEERYDITLVSMDWVADAESFNAILRSKLESRKITLNKFWLEADRLQKLNQGQTISMIYNQGPLKSSYLVTLFKQGNRVTAVGTTVVHDRDTLLIVNRFNAVVYGMSLMVLMVLVWAFSKRITRPLEQLGQAASEVSSLSFTEVNLKTGDELEILAEHMNAMSRKLKTAYEALDQKNENLKRFSADISHELKTPIALVKAYGSGIRDGLDDGTYATTIIKQADRLEALVTALLEYAKLQNDEPRVSEMSLQQGLQDVLGAFKLPMEEQGITLSCVMPEEQIFIKADSDKMHRVLTNLVSNAVRYTTNHEVRIKLEQIDGAAQFEISNGIGNGIQNDTQIEEAIWEPFVVGDASRDKSSSGTGLGLSIVATLLSQHGFEYGHRATAGHMTVWIRFSKRWT